MGSETGGRRRLLITRPTLGPGGADRVTLTLLRELPREKFELALALMRPEGPYLGDLPDDVDLIDLRVRHLWQAPRPLARVLTERRPDILFSTSGGMNLAACRAARALPGCRLVLSERNVLTGRDRGPKRIALRLSKRALYPRADCVTAVSRGVADDLVRRLDLPPDRVRVVYNPVVGDDLATLAAQPPAHPWFDENVPVVVAAGRLVPQKDFALLLSAFARLRSTHRARLLILGDGPERSRLESRVRRLGLEADVHLPGFDKNPFRSMSRAALFVLSSRFEGLPGVLIQAMACGAPVVATDCPGGPAEVVTHGETGLLVPVGDVAALAAAMARLLADAGEGARLAAAGRRAVERFRTGPVIERYVAALLGDSSDD